MTIQPPSAPSAPDPEAHELMLDVLRSQVKSQDDQVSSLRTAASILIAAGGVVLSRITQSDVTWGNPLIAVLLLAGGIATTTAVLAAVMVVRPVFLWRNPKPGELLQRYFNQPMSVLRPQLMAEFVASYEKSEATTTKMIHDLKVSAFALAIAVLSLLAGAVVKWGVQSMPNDQQHVVRATVQIAKDRRSTHHRPAIRPRG